MPNVATIIQRRVEREVNEHPEIIIFNVLKRFEQEDERKKILDGYDFIKKHLFEGVVMRHKDGYYTGLSQKEKIKLPDKLQNLYNHFRMAPVSYCSCEYCETTAKYVNQKKNLNYLKRRWEDGWDNSYPRLRKDLENKIDESRYHHRIAKEKMLRAALEGVNEQPHIILREFKDLHFDFVKL